MLYTIDDIRMEMTAAGSHWWDNDSMRAFGTRINGSVHQGPGGIYFVTSEKSYGGRGYSVRQYHPETKDIDTIDEFCSWTRAGAIREASRLAKTPLQMQFDDAMCALDLAVTGKTKRKQETKYGDINVVRECDSGSLIYLSDGGYTRVSPHRYDDGSGIYFEVHPTYNNREKDEAARQSFRDNYKLQREVSRVLVTRPAGEEGRGEGKLSDRSDAEQLVLDIERNGGKCSIAQAERLMHICYEYHRISVDVCNGTCNEKWAETTQSKLEDEALETLKNSGCGAKFGGDPRGCVFKLILPNGATNDWGKEGWCVPRLKAYNKVLT